MNVNPQQNISNSDVAIIHMYETIMTKRVYPEDESLFQYLKVKQCNPPY